LLAFGLFTLIYLFFLVFLGIRFRNFGVVCFFAVFLFIDEVFEYCEVNYSDMEEEVISDFKYGDKENKIINFNQNMFYSKFFNYVDNILLRNPNSHLSII
jgi:hypothetical protein